MILGKICKISGIILAILEIIGFCVISNKLYEPLFIVLGFFVAFFTVLGLLVCGKTVSLLDQIHSRLYIISYNSDEIVNKCLGKKFDLSAPYDSNVSKTGFSTHEQKECWTCKSCGTQNNQNALYCRNCGTYK